MRALVNDVAVVIALLQRLWRERDHFFAGEHGVAAHVVVEARRRKYADEANGFGSDVLYADPGMRRNEHGSPGVKVALAASDTRVDGSFHDVENFVLPEVFVSWNLAARGRSSVTMTSCCEPLFFGLTLRTKSPGGGSRQIRRSPSFFSSRRGCGAAWGAAAELDLEVEFELDWAELDCAELDSAGRVCKTQTASAITAAVAHTVLIEREFIVHPLSCIGPPDWLNAELAEVMVEMLVHQSGPLVGS